MTGMLHKYKEFVRLTEKAERLQKSGAASEVIYDEIFSDDISGAVKQLGLSFEYYDPDTSYEEDVQAYVRAMRERADEYEKLIRASGPDEEEYVWIVTLKDKVCGVYSTSKQAFELADKDSSSVVHQRILDSAGWYLD